MNAFSLTYLETYWTGNFLQANLLIGMNLVGALMLGMLVGYERAYNGRAAGMRTYGLVCMASTALTVFVGFPNFWYGGAMPHLTPDPTRVVQGIVTGIGFLCAGVIMKDGLSISGLTTAASIWAASAIGVLLGVGFYAAALLLALLCAVSMAFLHKLEAMLPSKATLGVTLTFKPGMVPQEDALIKAAAQRGFMMVKDTLVVTYEDGKTIWRFAAIAQDRARMASAAQLAQDIMSFESVSSFQLMPSRN